MIQAAAKPVSTSTPFSHHTDARILLCTRVGVTATGWPIVNLDPHLRQNRAFAGLGARQPGFGQTGCCMFSIAGRGGFSTRRAKRTSVMISHPPNSRAVTEITPMNTRMVKTTSPIRHRRLHLLAQAGRPGVGLRIAPSCRPIPGLPAWTIKEKSNIAISFFRPVPEAAFRIGHSRKTLSGTRPGSTDSCRHRKSSICVDVVSSIGAGQKTTALVIATHRRTSRGPPSDRRGSTRCSPLRPPR
jgi:hypothetical protein